ncbi:L-fucose kinase-like [Lineus longissimus]|uniref:L-fucose kinase-like n=1 Tax=Lineus longissimus TaxID=88925 RepID=UPI002B4C3C7B
MKWTAIALTCHDKRTAQTFQKELDLRQEKGIIDGDTVLLTVEDPKARVGSGGATINALLVVAEHLSAHAGFTVVNPDLLSSSSILLMHVGRQYPFDACSSTFTSLPATYKSSSHHHVLTNFDHLLHTMSTKIAVGCPCGVWVCSTDMVLSVPENKGSPYIDWTDSIDVCAVSMLGTVQYAKQHGVYKIGSENKDDRLLDIIYKGDQYAIKSCAREDGSVALVSGVVFFNPTVAETLVMFGQTAQLYACTYMGLDSGLQPIELSLFFDFLVAMATDVSKDDFVSGERNAYLSKKVTRSAEEIEVMRQAREVIWKELRDYKVKVVVIPDGEFHYLSLSAGDFHKTVAGTLCLDDTQLKRNHVMHASIHPTVNIDDASIVVNSILEEDVHVGAKSLIVNSHLANKFSIGKDSFVNGVRLEDLKNVDIGSFSDSVMLQSFPLLIPTLGKAVTNILTVLGKFDDLMVPSWKHTATYCNMPWLVFMNKTGITAEDLWGPALPDDDRCVFTAQLFPLLNASHQVGLAEIFWLQTSQDDGGVADMEMLQRWRSSWRLSLKDILSFLGLENEFGKRSELGFEITKRIVKENLTQNGDYGLLNLYRTACLNGFQHELLALLDEVALEGARLNLPALVGRTCAHIADVLACMIGKKGGLRSGPAANVHWKKAFLHFEDGELGLGVQAMSSERRNWLGRPDLLVRAGRHYEGAAQILIRKVISTAREFIKPTPCEPVPYDKVVVAECPARMDIAGAWSDTPPITYEHGGAVIGAAITIDDMKPIGAKVQRLREPEVILVLDNGGHADVVLKLTKLHEFSNYSQPHAPGALLKAAFLCAKIIEYPSSVALDDQLVQKYGGGFHVTTWSNLPHGSGMGTSSILAGGLMAALWKASGKSYDHQTLIHAVLYLEQMLTTGGGWQDQVGGLLGGIKVGHSKPELPVFLDYTYPKISVETMQTFASQLILIYSGRTRLAKNLLQDVIRNWYNRDSLIVKTENRLVASAWECAKAFEEEDIAKVGSLMDENWSLKKSMAPGCEPHLVKQMMEALRPHVLGMCMAGAGGGGFLYVLTRQPYSMALVKSVLWEVPGTEKITFHRVDIDVSGLEVKVEDIEEVKKDAIDTVVKED